MTGASALLSGVHHVRIPVSSLEAAAQWFAELLGYEREFPFTAEGLVTGWALRHSAGGPALALIEDPIRARVCRGFPLLAFGLPNATAVRAMADRLDSRGITHGGVQPALVEVKLPFVEGPDGILFGFYVKPEEFPDECPPEPDASDGAARSARRINSVNGRSSG